jgi:alcohol dehydrogenase class IV
MEIYPSFAFSTVPKLICQPGAALEIASHICTAYPHVRHALIVTDPGLLATGLLTGPIGSLEAAGITTMVYSDVVADPPEHIIHKAVAALGQSDAANAVVIGIGGGSSMDVAKLVAVLAGSGQALSQMYGIGNVSGARLPLVLVPTTAGTGSEVTNIAIVTTGDTTKMGVVAPQLYADIAVLDAELTVGLPRHVTAATGIDAMVHAIEAYTSKHKKNPLSDFAARQALTLLVANLPAACAGSISNPQIAARQAMLLGAMLAGQAFSNAPVAAVHALAYPIGGIFHVPHGLSNALVLPHVLRFNLPEAAGLYAELAAIVAPQAGGSVEARANALIVALEEIVRDTGIPKTLREVGVKPDDLDRLADEAMLQTRLLGNNPRTLSRQDAYEIYSLAH